jgi:hypothetical protein
VDTILNAIWVQPEKHTLRQEVPTAITDDLQETHDDSQEAPDVPQDTRDVPQEAREVPQVAMTHTWRDLGYDAEADILVENHFCGNSGKDPTKPSRAVLLQLLLKEKVASGRLVIDEIVEGVPVIVRGKSDDGRAPVIVRPPNPADDPPHFDAEDQSQSQSHLQSCLQSHSQSQSQSSSQSHLQGSTYSQPQSRSSSHSQSQSHSQGSTYSQH